MIICDYCDTRVYPESNGKLRHQCEKNETFEARVEKLEDKQSIIRKMVDAQAEDEGLWFEAETAPEAYIQQELRNLHKIIESETSNE